MTHDTDSHRFVLPESGLPRFELSYWPLPFRGCFISYLFAYRDIPLAEVSDFDHLHELYGLDPSEQPVPFMGPPLLTDRAVDRTLSQMPAMVLYVSRGLGLLPEDPFDEAMGMKVLMDCNDVLMELCRYNGSTMWDRESWHEFRTRRFPRWLRIFEESLTRGFIGQAPVTFADLGVFSLFGNMMRCLPELEPDLLKHAPEVHALCRKIGTHESLARRVAAHQERYGDLYCDGQIERSIREMLARDAQGGFAP